MVKKLLFVLGACALALSTQACKDSMSPEGTPSTPFTKLIPDFTSTGHASLMPLPYNLALHVKQHRGGPQDSSGGHHGRGFWDDDSLDRGDSLHLGDTLRHDDSLGHHDGDHDGHQDRDNDSLDRDDTLGRDRDHLRDSTGCGFGDLKEQRFASIVTQLNLTAGQADSIKTLFAAYNANVLKARQTFSQAYRAIYAQVESALKIAVDSAIKNGNVDYKMFNDILNTVLAPYRPQLEAIGKAYHDAVDGYEKQFDDAIKLILTADQYKKWKEISR